MELILYTFVQYAFAGGISLAILAGILGPFVVQSKQAFASDMFAHVALAGIGGALVLGLGPWWGALPALLLVSTMIWYLSESEKYSPEALSIFFLSGGLALALALVHIAKDSVFSFENYLFGSILTLTGTEVITIGLFTFAISLLVYLLWYPLIGATSNPQYLIPYRNTPKIIRLLYFWILAIVVWIGIKTIGGLLIGALLVIPTLIVQSWTYSFRQTVLFTTIVSTLSVLSGLLLSLYVDLPPTSLIIASLFLIFIIQSFLQTLYKR